MCMDVGPNTRNLPVVTSSEQNDSLSPETIQFPNSLAMGGLVIIYLSVLAFGLTCFCVALVGSIHSSCWVMSVIIT